MRSIVLALGLSLSALAQDASLRELMREEGLADTLSLARSVPALFAIDSGERRFVALYPTLSDSLQYETAFDCGKEGRSFELLVALIREAVRDSDEYGPRGGLLQAASKLSLRFPDEAAWVDQVPWAFSGPFEEQGLIAEVLAKGGGEVARTVFTHAFTHSRRELLARALGKLPRSAVVPAMLDPLATLVLDQSSPVLARRGAARAMAGRGKEAMDRLVACLVTLEERPPSSDRDAVADAVHAALVEAFGADLGRGSERWRRRGVPEPVLGFRGTEAQSSAPDWSWSLAISALCCLLGGALQLFKRHALGPYFLVPLAALGLLFAWTEVLSEGGLSRLWPGGALIALTVIVGIELTVLAMSRPWLENAPEPRLRTATAGPRASVPIGQPKASAEFSTRRLQTAFRKLGALLERADADRQGNGPKELGGRPQADPQGGSRA